MNSVGKNLRIISLFIFYFMVPFTFCFANGNLELYLNRDERAIEISLLQNESKINIKGNIDNNENFYLNGSLNNIVLFGRNVMLDILGSGKIRQSADDILLRGSLLLKHIVSDGKPLDDLILNYHIENSKLFVTSCRWGAFSLRGEINLNAPYDAIADIVISDIDLKDFAKMLGIGSDELLLSGRIFGLVHLQLKDNLISIKAQLHSWDGVIKKLEFKQANIVIEGTFPKMNFVNSWLVKKEDGTYMNIEGYFDLTKLCDLKLPNHKVELIPQKEKFEFLNWMVNVKKGIEEGVNLEKAISSDIVLSMDTFSHDSNNNVAHIKNDNALGLEYKMSEEQRLKMSIKEDEERIGWEQVFKF